MNQFYGTVDVSRSLNLQAGPLPDGLEEVGLRQEFPDSWLGDDEENAGEKTGYGSSD